MDVPASEMAVEMGATNTLAPAAGSPLLPMTVIRHCTSSLGVESADDDLIFCMNERLSVGTWLGGSPNRKQGDCANAQRPGHEKG